MTDAGMSANVDAADLKFAGIRSEISSEITFVLQGLSWK